MQPDSNKNPRHPPQGAGITDIAIPGVNFKPAMQLPSDELAAFSRPASAAPLLSFNDPVTNPNLDFTGPIATPAPVARKFILPKAMSATFSGTAVPTPSGALQQLITSLSSPPDQAVQISASSWLRALPRFGPDNLLVKSSTPWIAGLSDTLSLADASLERQPIGEFDLARSLSTGQPANGGRRHQSSGKSDRIRPEGRWGRLLRPHDHRHPDHQVRRGVPALFRPSNWTTNGRHTGSTRRSDCQSACPPLAYPRSQTRAVPSPSLSTPLALACGSGPTVTVDNTSMPTQVTGTLGDLINLQPVRIRTCASPTATLTAGHHVISFPTASAFRVTSLLVGQTSGSSTSDNPRHVTRDFMDSGKTDAEDRHRACHVRSGRAELQYWLGGDPRRSHAEGGNPERLGTRLGCASRGIGGHDHEVRA